MLRTGKLEESRTRCAPRRRPGHPFWKIDLIESDEGPQPAPQVFAVQMDPGSSLGTHFHFQDQFQLVIKGGGTIGRSPLQHSTMTCEPAPHPLCKSTEGAFLACTSCIRAQ